MFQGNRNVFYNHKIKPIGSRLISFPLPDWWVWHFYFTWASEKKIRFMLCDHATLITDIDDDVELQAEKLNADELFTSVEEKVFMLTEKHLIQKVF